MKSLPIVICFTLSVAKLFAQADTTRRQPQHRQMERWLTVVTGYDYYGRSGGEIGIGKFVAGSGIDASWGAIYASSEFFYAKSLFVGPKVGAYVAGGISLGVNFIYYTNFTQSSLQFRPEIGLGADIFRIYYGRNMRITNTDFNFISKNLIGVNLYFKVKKLGTIQKRQHKLQLQ